jgi:hypothetical protein
MFAIFNYAIIVYSFFVLREVCLRLYYLPKEYTNKLIKTAGKSLEEMEEVFSRGDKTLKGDNVDIDTQSSNEPGRDITKN